MPGLGAQLSLPSGSHAALPGGVAAAVRPQRVDDLTGPPPGHERPGAAGGRQWDTAVATGVQRTPFQVPSAVVLRPTTTPWLLIATGVL